MANFEKLKISARYFLLGLATHNHDYYKVIEAMELMLRLHTGKRNGGEPEAIHQLGIFHQVRCMHEQLSDPITTYITVFLHDAGEDKNLQVETVKERFGEKASKCFDLISKNIGDETKDLNTYLANCFNDEVVSVVKLADRINNVSTMVGVFKPERLARYIKETREEYVPLIKVARRKFPAQEPIYENFKLQLLNQLKLIDNIVDLPPAIPPVRHITCEVHA